MWDAAEVLSLCRAFFVSMACRESKGGAVLTCLGLLALATSLCDCTKPTRLKALDGSRETSVHTKIQPERGHLHHGRLLIGQSSLKAAKLNGTNSTDAMLDDEAESDYQADMGWQTKQLIDKSDWQKTAMDSLLKMESKVECTQDFMKLLVHDAASTPSSLIFVDRGKLSPLSLTKLPPSCGYTIRSTQTDLALVAPYDGCFIIIQENYYVLPLLWWGLPVRMTCPLMGHESQNPPMVTCHAEGMVVKTKWPTSASKIKVNVNGNWEPLLMAAKRCVFGIVEHPEGVVISVRYAPCIVKKDGMHTLELAADAETKVSCPSLLVAKLKTTEHQVKDSVQESGIPEKWLFPTPYPALQIPLTQTAPQIPSFSQSPKKPSNQNRGSNPGQFPYHYFSSFPYAYLQNPGTTHSKEPETPTPVKSTVTASADNVHPHPFYPQVPFPVVPHMMPQVTHPPLSKIDKLHKKPEPPASVMHVPQQNFNSLYYTGVLSQLSDLYPAQLNQRFYPFNPQPKPTQKPAATQSPQPATPQAQMNPSFFPFYPKPTQKPAATQPPQPATPQAQIFPHLFHFYPQPQPTQKPAVTQPPRPASPQAQIYPSLFPFYPKPTQKPAVTRPPQPANPQAQIYPSLFPFYPKPTQKPAVTQPPQPATPEAHIYPHLFHFYPQPQPTQKPAVTFPPQLFTPQSQAYPPFFHFYTQSKAAQKPTVTQKLQPITSQGKVHHQVFDFYPTPKPASKHTTVTQPQQLQLKGQVSQPVYPYQLFTQPKPTLRPPAEPQTQQPKQPEGQEWRQMCYSQLLAENQLENIPTKGQLYGPCQYSKLPMSAIFSPPQGQVKNPFNSQHPQSVQLPSPTFMQQLAAVASEQKMDYLRSKHGYPVYCPQHCQPGLTNCCLQIAFHHHFHIFAPDDGKAEPHFYRSFSPVPHSGFGPGLGTAEPPLKHSAALLQPAKDCASGQISPRAPQTPDKDNKDFFQPAEGIAILPRSGLGMNLNQEPGYSNFGTEFHNPLWTRGAQHMELQGLEQGKPESSMVPSKLWLPGSEQLKSVGQTEHSAFQFPEQSINSRPDFMSYLGQQGLRTGEKQNKPAVQQKSLYKSEYERSTHNFKRAIDGLFSPYYMPGDSPVYNNSLGLNGSQEHLWEKGSKNMTKLHEAEDERSEPQSYVLLQRFPPGREPRRFSDSQSFLGDFANGGNSKALKLLRHNVKPQTLESLQEKRQELKQLEEGKSNQPPGNNYMQRDGDASGLFTLMSDDSVPGNSYPQQSISAERLNPDVLKSFENLWKSDFRQWFQTYVHGITEERDSMLDKKEMDKLLQMNKNPEEK